MLPNAQQSHDNLAKHHSVFGSHDFFVPKHYVLPRKVSTKCLEILDVFDSPDKPGMIRESTLVEMVQRFDRTFAGGGSLERSEQVDLVMEHLRRHTRRRRGASVLQEGIVEWEQTARVYQLFAVELNMFERIFFTVDVSESTALSSKLFSYFVIVLIIFSIVTWMISTLPSMQEIPDGCVGTVIGECSPRPRNEFQVMEAMSIYLFTTEYLVRLLTVHSVRFALLDERFLESVLCGSRRAAAKPQTRADSVYMSRCSVEEAGPSTSSSEGTPDPSNNDAAQAEEAAGTVVAAERQGSKTMSARKLDGKLVTVVNHVFGPSNLVDLAAILPFWLNVFWEGGDSGFLLVLRVLRLTRVFRVFKLGKYNDAFLMFSRVMHQSLPALLLMVFFIVLGCCLFGTLLWFAEQGAWHPAGHPALIHIGIVDRGAYLRHEHDMDDDVLGESPFYSIIHSFWFVIVTITTVGYGEIVPRTTIGKLIGAVAILSGVIVLAMPIGVVGANFSSGYYRIQDEKKKRARLREELDLLTALENEQDAANHNPCDDSGMLGSTATEFQRVGTVRQQLLTQAELLEQRWQDVFPSLVSTHLGRDLRQLCHSLLGGEAAGMASVKATVTPIVYVQTLDELDMLENRFKGVVLMSMSLDAGADFGLKEAHMCRRQFTEFSNRCWDYVAEVCHVEQPPDPGELFQMKAQLVRQLSGEGRKLRSKSKAEGRKTGPVEEGDLYEAKELGVPSPVAGCLR